MKYFKKYGLPIFSVVILALVYALVRIPHLTSIPLFTDESIYIRWAQIGLHDPLYRFLSLTDGKQPLFIWVMYPFFKLFHDPLVAGRMESIMVGFFTMLGLGILSWTLFRNRLMAFLTMVLYLFYPFAQIMDRMALYDSMVAMFFVWALYVSVLLVKYLRFDIALILGFVFGAGILTKTSNFLSIYFVPLTLFLFDFKHKHREKRFLQWVGYLIVAVIISQIMYAVLRLSPLPNVINQKNNTFYYPFSEWIHHPFTYLISNLQGMLNPLLGYLTFPYIILILVSLVLLKKDFREKAMLFLYFLLPFVGFAFIGKEIFARYVFFMSLPLLVLAGWGLFFVIEWLRERLTKESMGWLAAVVIIVIVAVGYPAYVCFAIAKDPIHAPIPQDDKTQYITSWTAGWGLKEAVSFFEAQASNGPIYIATEGTFGLYPQGIELYLAQNPNIHIKGYYWEITPVFPQEIAEKSATMPTYFVFYQPCPGGICPRPGDAPSGWPVQQVKEFLTPGTDTRVVIYQVQKGMANENTK